MSNLQADEVACPFTSYHRGPSAQILISLSLNAFVFSSTVDRSNLAAFTVTSEVKGIMILCDKNDELEEELEDEDAVRCDAMRPKRDRIAYSFNKQSYWMWWGSGVTSSGIRRPYSCHERGTHPRGMDWTRSEHGRVTKSAEPEKSKSATSLQGYIPTHGIPRRSVLKEDN